MAIDAKSIQASQDTAAAKADFIGPPEKLTDQGIPAGTEMGVAFDDNGNLLPGWQLNSSGQYYTQNDPKYVDQATVNSAAESRAEFAQSQALDANGKLKDGYTYDEFGTPVKTDGATQEKVKPEEDPFEKARQDANTREESSPTEQTVIDATDEPQMTKEDKAALEKQQADNRAKLRAEETAQPASTGKIVPILPAKDWRFRMSIAPTLQALYNTASTGDILSPLKATGGVIFPYTPQIQTGYRANYEPGDLVHTNYKNYFYKNSSVDDLTITAEFTAQDQVEAQYLLAVIHFFRSVTKMFYGQDKSPNAGTPPPLVFLSGLGAYQYDNHPVLISSFNYTLPNDVDYIRTTSTGGYSGPGATPSATKGGLTGLATTASKFGFSGVANMLSGVNRLMGAGLNKGGGITPGGITARAISNKVDTTYVPTKIQISITAYPIISRRDMSQNFSLEKYAKGTIYRGSQRGGSGIW